jgi:hypothetical protein
MEETQIYWYILWIWKIYYQKVLLQLLSKVILLRGDATETDRVTDCSLSPYSGLKLHYIIYLFSSYAGVSVRCNFVLLPVSVASPLNNITLLLSMRTTGKFNQTRGHCALRWSSWRCSLLALKSNGKVLRIRKMRMDYCENPAKSSDHLNFPAHLS